METVADETTVIFLSYGYRFGNLLKGTVVDPERSQLLSLS